MRTLACLLVCSTALAADPPIPPTFITLSRSGLTLPAAAAEIRQQAGINLNIGSLPADQQVPAKWDRIPVWTALDRLAELGHARLVIRQPNTQMLFESPAAITAANVDGPFRVQAQEVLARLDPIRGGTTYDLTLEVLWEPRLAVYRIDSAPTITSATDDRGRSLSARKVSARSAVTGSSHRMDVRLEGITRESRSIATLSGEFRVTASPKLLTFRCAEWGKLPHTEEQNGVKLTIRRVRRIAAVWEVTVELEYPQSMPNFESFESWATHNRLKLISADRTRTVEPLNVSEAIAGRFATLDYRFAADRVDLSQRAGWSFVYDTPDVLVEQRVSLELKNVRLP